MHQDILRLFEIAKDPHSMLVVTDRPTTNGLRYSTINVLHKSTPTTFALIWYEGSTDAVHSMAFSYADPFNCFLIAFDGEPMFDGEIQEPDALMELVKSVQSLARTLAANDLDHQAAKYLDVLRKHELVPDTTIFMTDACSNFYDE